ANQAFCERLKLGASSSFLGKYEMQPVASAVQNQLQPSEMAIIHGQARRRSIWMISTNAINELVERPTLVARALLLSLLAVALFVAAIGGLGWLLEAEQLKGTDPLSIHSCVINGQEQQAISLFRQGGSKKQLGVHPLANGEVPVENAWLDFEPICMTGFAKGG